MNGTDVFKQINTGLCIRQETDHICICSWFFIVINNVFISVLQVFSKNEAKTSDSLEWATIPMITQSQVHVGVFSDGVNGSGRSTSVKVIIPGIVSEAEIPASVSVLKFLKWMAWSTRSYNWFHFNVLVLHAPRSLCGRNWPWDRTRYFNELLLIFSASSFRVIFTKASIIPR